MEWGAAGSSSEFLVVYGLGSRRDVKVRYLDLESFISIFPSVKPSLKEQHTHTRDSCSVQFPRCHVVSVI